MSDDMKPVISNRSYYRNKELAERHKEEGDITVLEKATFLGSEPNKFDPSKNDWIFDLNDQEHVLNTSGHLNWQMGKISEGDLVTVIYKGTEIMQQGQMKGKEAHQWDVRFKKHPDNEMAPKVVTRKAEPAADSSDIPF